MKQPPPARRWIHRQSAKAQLIEYSRQIYGNTILTQRRKDAKELKNFFAPLRLCVIPFLTKKSPEGEGFYTLHG
jgi:hypothetical protein